MQGFPRLRALDAFTLEDRGRKMVALRDPLGVFSNAAVVSPELFHIACLFDGNRSVEAVHQELEKIGFRIPKEELDRLVQALDQHLLLDSPRFQSEIAKQRDAFTASPTRPAFHAGSVYPNAAERARQQMEEMLQHGASIPAEPGARALLCPHIDFFRGATTYGKSYACLKNLAPPDLFVVLGTSHGPTKNLLALTKKNYETPWGDAKTDGDFVDLVAKKISGDPFADDFCHRAEHSVEFQIHFLKFLFPDTPVAPILVGGLLSRIPQGGQPAGSAEIEQSIAAIQGALRERKNAFLVLGVDLAHIGPRFGGTDLQPVYLSQVEKEDRISLERAAKLDSEGFFQSVIEGGDPRNICGLAPIYLGLRVLENVQGKLLDYQQCTSEDQSVTVAGMVFSDPGSLASNFVTSA